MQITSSKPKFINKTIYFDISNIFFRYWSYNHIGKVSNKVLYIQGTPHYHLARKSLNILEEKTSIERVIDTVEYKNYEKYSFHESRSYGQKIHSAEKYKNLISMFYSTSFDLEKYPIEAAEFGKLSNGQLLYYILDGAHRAAYLAALNSLHNSSKKVKLITCYQVKHWPDVQSVIFSDKTIRLNN